MQPVPPRRVIVPRKKPCQPVCPGSVAVSSHDIVHALLIRRIGLIQTANAMVKIEAMLTGPRQMIPHPVDDDTVSVGANWGRDNLHRSTHLDTRRLHRC